MVPGSYTSSEDATDTITSSDDFTMIDTQTDTLNIHGLLWGGQDHDSYNETGNDTSGESDRGGAEVAGVSGVSDISTSSSGGSGLGGHMEHARRQDPMDLTGVLRAGDYSFTWSGSDSESLDNTSTDGDGLTVDENGLSGLVTLIETAIRNEKTAMEMERGTDGKGDMALC